MKFKQFLPTFPWNSQFGISVLCNQDRGFHKKGGKHDILTLLKVKKLDGGK